MAIVDLLAFARGIAERVEAEASRTGVPVAVCMVDFHGNLILELHFIPQHSCNYMRWISKALFHRGQNHGQPDHLNIAAMAA
jgi:hypothetical protein